MCRRIAFHLVLMFSVLAIEENDFNVWVEPEFFKEKAFKSVENLSYSFPSLLISFESKEVNSGTDVSPGKYLDIFSGVLRNVSDPKEEDKKNFEERETRITKKEFKSKKEAVENSRDFYSDDLSRHVYDVSKNFIRANFWLFYRTNCGETRVRIKRIIGGRDSKFGSHPWQIALFKKTFKGRPYCGGALLNDRWIITAAHCVEKKPIKSLTVRLGELNAESKIDDRPLNRNQYKVKKKKIHPEYSDKRHRHDIALLKLDRAVNFDENIVPICLPNQGLNLIGRTATVAGWGRRKNDEEKSSPTILNEVNIEVIPNEVCQRWFSEAGHLRKINDIFLCAGHSSGGRDSCKGDSGGPLTTSVNGREVLIGIVSWGFGCGKKHSPGVYTNIKKFVPWIAESINEE